MMSKHLKKTFLILLLLMAALLILYNNIRDEVKISPASLGTLLSQANIGDKNRFDSKWVITPLVENESMNHTCKNALNDLVHWKIAMYSEMDVFILRLKHEDNGCLIRQLTMAEKDILGNAARNLASIYPLGGREKALGLALMSGASHIYLADSLTFDAMLKGLQFVLEDKYRGPVYTGSVDQKTGIPFDIDVHFGCAKVMDKKSKVLSTRYEICATAAPAIQSYAFTSSLPDCQEAIPIVIKGQKMPLALLLENTLYRRETFWAIPLAKTDTEEEDILWSFLVQQQIHSHGLNIQINGLKDIDANKSIWKKKMAMSTGRILLRYDSDLHLNIKSALEGINRDGHFSEKWMGLQQKWMELTGYEQRQKKKNYYNCTQKMIAVPWRKRNSQSRLESIKDKYENVCEGTPRQKHVDITKPWVQHDDIALIIIFNNVFDQVIPIVELMYKPFFPIIVHCSPRHRNKDGLSKIGPYLFVEYVSEYATRRGGVNYECAQLGFLLRLPVKGFLFLADDAIVSISGIHSYPRDRSWCYNAIWTCPVRPPGERMAVNYGGLKLSKSCDWWMRTRMIHSSPMNQALKEMATRKDDETLQKCGKTLNSLIKSSSSRAEIFLRAISDFFYVPATMMPSFLKVTDIFTKHLVFLELAVPTALYCTSGREALVNIEAFVLFFGNRSHTEKYIEMLKAGTHSFIHPIKWSRVVKKEKNATISFCQQLLPHLHSKPNGTKPYKLITL